MADGKWIENLTPDLPLEDAARQVLMLRLQVIVDYLPRALGGSAADVENVHQLRVGTRRADAALRLFRACLPRRVYRKARERLRSLRRAAGAARDADVFLVSLEQREQTVPAEQHPGLDFLIGHALGERTAAQERLASVGQAEAERLPALVESVLEAVRPAGKEALVCLGDLAGPIMALRLERLEQAASGKLQHYEELHQVRIAGKRLRYVMEVLGDCYGPTFREEVYPRVEEMQETLGRANDSHVACQRLAALRDRAKAWPRTWARVKPGVEGLLRFHQRRLPQERRRFVKWWAEWRQLEVAQMVVGR